VDLSGSPHNIDPDFGLASHTISKTGGLIHRIMAGHRKVVANPDSGLAPHAIYVGMYAETGGLIHRIMAGHSQAVLISMCNLAQPVILEWENLVLRKNGHG
jgi:hypothetical protein